MIIPFDKVYVLTMPNSKLRQEFINYQFKQIGVDFEFVYGIDFGNIINDALGNEIIYPNIYDSKTYYESLGRDFSCAVNHYSAIYRAFEFEFNSVLVVEDDICFIKDLNRLRESFENIPKDADFVTWDPRFWWDYDFAEFKNCLYNSQYFIKDTGQFRWTFGGMCYGIMNRQSMELYLKNQRSSFHMSDHVEGFFHHSSVNKYMSSICICTDQFNLKHNFDIKPIVKNWRGYTCNYENIVKDDFYTMKEYDEFVR